MIHLNAFSHVSKDVKYKLKIAGITALVIGTGWYLHKYYEEYHNTQHSTSITSISNPDSLDLEHKTNDPLNIQQYTIKETTKADEINIYTPVIHVYDAVYGISRIELDNLTGEETEFQIEINNNNKIQLINFHLNNIAIDRLTHKEYIHLRLPLHLKDYSIQLRIRYKPTKIQDTIQDIWSAFSTQINLNIPSSLISKQFKLNEKVTFVPKGSNHGSNGTIIKILDIDGIYLIKELNRNLNTSKNHIVHFSRIYRQGPYLYNVINATNKLQNRIMNKTMLVNIDENDEKYDVELMDVFDILCRIYQQKAEEILIEMNEEHYVFIGRFIGKYVMDFLLNDNRKYHLVNCMMEYKHKFMKLVPVWNNSVRNVFELNKMGLNIQINSNCSYSCDLCGMEISKFDWIYRCDANITDRHFFCLMCVWDMIQQHKQLTEFLKQYLRKYLYDVCIEEISSFVCGSVVYCH